MTGYQILSRVYVEDSKRIRTKLRENIKQHYPDRADEMRAGYGISPADEKGLQERGNDGKSDIILIHGMDDPGKVWMNLSPVLMNEGFRVWIMTYPNDQPISESARLFFEEMADLTMQEIQTVSIVAHSMGGLVAREMMTSPELAFAKGVSDGSVPRITRLIMIATPNHGAELARFRILGEFRDQLVNMLSGDYFWLRGILDGAGEAGLDMIPGSPFLESLNARPHPEDVAMCVIAGVLSTWESAEIDQFIDSVKDRLPSTAHESVGQIGDLLHSMAYGAGDGLVPVNSARLDGFPLHIVAGTHLSIIRNISETSRRVPPAVPLVLESLNEGI